MQGTINISFKAKWLQFCVAFIVVVFQGCGSSSEYTRPYFPSVDFKAGYDFSKIKTIGIYVKPTGLQELDQTYFNVVSLDFISRGYQVTDLNKMLVERGETTFQWNGHAAARDSLLKKTYLSDHQMIVTINAQWDSMYVITYLSENPSYTSYGPYAIKMLRFGTWKVLSLYSELSIFDVASNDTLLSIASSDTCRLFSEIGNDRPSVREFPWTIVARQMTKALRNFPVCSVENSVPASVRVPVTVHVDQSYRAKFPDQWKERIQRRLLYASDIFRKQFGIELDLIGLQEWNTQYTSSLGSMLDKLWASTPDRDSSLRIGITLDPHLTKFWKTRARIGAAFPLGIHAIVTAQPSFPDVSDWNSIEEALTLVHEISHLLGAVHSSDELSIMYPAAGNISYDFDPLNRMIIDSLKRTFFSLHKEERTREFLKIVALSRTTKLRNSVEILNRTAQTIVRLQRSPYSSIFEKVDTVKLYAQLTDLISDSTFRFAVSGYIDFRRGRLELARERLTKAIEREPDFAEAHWYLSEVLKKLGKANEANTHFEIARQKGFGLFFGE